MSKRRPGKGRSRVEAARRLMKGRKRKPPRSPGLAGMAAGTPYRKPPAPSTICDGSGVVPVVDAEPIPGVVCGGAVECPGCPACEAASDGGRT